MRKDERLGAIADPFGGNEVEVLSPAQGIVIGGTNLPLVHEGDALFHIGRFEGTQVAAKTMDAFENDPVYGRKRSPPPSTTSRRSFDRAAAALPREPSTGSG